MRIFISVILTLIALLFVAGILGIFLFPIVAIFFFDQSFLWLLAYLGPVEIIAYVCYVFVLIFFEMAEKILK